MKERHERFRKNGRSDSARMRVFERITSRTRNRRIKRERGRSAPEASGKPGDRYRNRCPICPGEIEERRGTLEARLRTGDGDKETTKGAKKVNLDEPSSIYK